MTWRSWLQKLVRMPSANALLLASYVAAEEKILSGQSYAINGRELRMPDLAEVRKERARLQMIVAREDAVACGRGGRFAQADFGGTA